MDYVKIVGTKSFQNYLKEIKNTKIAPEKFLYSQKDDCIVDGCKKESVLEALSGSASVRCCEDREHMEKAARIAKAYVTF